MKRAILMAIAFVAIMSCSSGDDPVVENKSETTIDDISVTWEVLEFEDTPEGDPPFYYASEVRVDNEGNFYITDAIEEEMSVKVFNSDGELIHKIGRKGRGPGEFESFRGFSVDKESGEMLVFDSDTKRITKLTSKGDVLDTYINEKLGIMSTFFQDEGRRIVLSSHFMTDSKRGHVVDEGYQSVSEFMPSADFKEGLEEIIQQAGIQVGKAIAHNDHLYFVPSVYTGKIFDYQFSETDQNYVLTREIPGTPVTEPYKLLGKNDSRRADLRFVSPDGEMNVLMLSKSMGLFHNGEYFYNFLVVEEGDQRSYGFELFDQSWNLLGFKTIETVEVNTPDEEDREDISISLQDVDSDGNFIGRARFEDDWVVIKLTVDTSSL